MVPINTMAASQEYKNLMQPILDQATHEKPQKAKTQCYKPRPAPQSSSFDKSFPDFFLACFSWTKRQLQKPFAKQEPQEVIPLHPTVQLIQSQMRALQPFSEMTPKQLSQAAVGIQIPSWLAGSEEACHIIEAAEKTFGRLASFEKSPSSAYTAAGYELCRISRDEFECTGPGRIMTLEYDDEVAAASVMQTPLFNVFANSVTFSVRRGLTSQSMIDWIDAFIDSQKPDMLMLAGAGADDASFVEAVKGSRAASLLDGHSSSLPATQVLVLGVAQTAKDTLENQNGCAEWDECWEIRRKADAIAGVYNPPAPPIWPAVGSRHVEL